MTLLLGENDKKKKSRRNFPHALWNTGTFGFSGQSDVFVLGVFRCHVAIVAVQLCEWGRLQAVLKGKNK